MADIVISGDVSGAVTLTAPAVAGTTTLTLPTTSGTLVVTGGAQTVQFAAGSAASPSITFTGDTNTGIFSPGADSIGFSEGGAEIARFDSSGQLNVGPFGGNGNAVIAGSSSPGFTNQPGTNLLLKSGDGSGTGSSFMTLSTSPAGSSGTTINTAVERMRITSAGDVGIGTSSPNGRVTIGNNATDTALSGTSNTQGLHLYARNFGVSQIDSLVSGSSNSGMSLRTYNNGTYTEFIANDQGNTTRFQTAGSERMRIDSSGNVSIGTTTTGGKLTILDGSININWANGYFNSLARGVTVIGGGYNDTTNKASITHVGGVGNNNNRCGWTAYSIKTNTVNNGAEYYIRPVIWNGSTFAEQGSAGVYLTDNATSWTSASDERLKENLEPIANAVEKVKTIRAVTGKYKADNDGTSRAFLIAQDVQAVLPEAVTENSEGYLGLAYTDTIPLLVAAIKELNAKVEAQAAEIAALKGAN